MLRVKRRTRGAATAVPLTSKPDGLDQHKPNKTLADVVKWGRSLVKYLIDKISLWVGLGETATAPAALHTASAAAGAVAVGIKKKAKANKLTVTQIYFEGLLHDDTGDAWPPANLRCSKITFQRLVDLVASKRFSVRTTSTRKHSYAMRIGGDLNFYASSGSYQATAAAMGMNESVLFEAVGDLTEFLVSLLPEVVTFPDHLDGW
ncbi:unnamed protein product [Phytophthora fragariaefolia]|uniref:Unnamed protein product n=1 Tax=Phytophthora fragariaefolia TaxID=1490495 RepID=A0A9W7CUA3_9STRA|nr:unnamed protein product [Phytophthora fragariaefolia]